jgi:hypothetical protein
MDPIGLALENFDGIGSYRTTENGVPIDTSGVLEGMKFANPRELGDAIAKSPATISCVVDRLTAYATGRPLRQADAPWTEALKHEFAQSGYVFPELMRAIALSPAFFEAPPPGGATQQTAQLNSSSQSHQEARK